MSEAQDGPHFVTNLSNQPLELHVPSGLQVVPPRGRVTVDAADLDAPQLRVLRASRLLMTDSGTAPDAATPDAATPEAPAPAEPGSKSELEV